jgi:ATP-dependent RNA helicase DeaD
MAKLFISAGREAGIRPQDLVGAISNEAGVTGKSIGAIQITERYSLVEVSEESAEQVMRALRNTKLRGKKVSVRRDRIQE